MVAKKKSVRQQANPGFEMPDKPLDLSGPPKAETADDALVREIRDDYRHFKDYWRENRDEMEIDMRFAGGDAFSADEHAFRKELSRPCETPDELSQYVKQTNNNLRQNKRDVNISPASEDATGEDAEKKESVLRGLNHRGNFQAAFQTAYEGCTWSGFGFFGISLKKTKDGHIEPRPRRIANQFTVLLDPYAKEADYSDQKKCLVLDIMRTADFAAEYSGAQKRSFSADDAKMAPDWVLGEEIVIAEAWRKEADGIYQYITNGLEILDKIKWAGSWIPIIPILGEEIYVTEGGRQKRKYLSLIRRARTPQKMLAYIASQELEEFGQAPRTPLLLWEGQELADFENLTTLNTAPVPFVKLKPTYGNNNELLPPPTRHPFVPNSAAYEMAREAWRRAVQAAVGISPLPTAAQRQNEKSGVALEKIQTQEAVGSYHFLDNANRALVNYGRQMDELIDKGMTAGRHVGVKNKDDSHGLLFLASSPDEVPAGADPKQVLVVGQGSFDVTITTEPSHESQRDKQSDFVDTLIANLKALPIPPPIATKVLAIAIRLKNVGAKGEAIADLLDPKEGDPAAAAQKAMGELQQQQQAMQEIQQELQKLQQEKAGHVVDNEYKVKLKQMDHQLEIAKLDNARAIAEIQTKAQEKAERESAIQEVFTELHGDAKDVGMQAAEHAHERDMAAQAHQNTLAQGDAAAGNQAALAQQAAENQPQAGA